MTTLALLAAHAGPGPWGAGWGWLLFLIPLFWIGVFALFFALLGRRWRHAGGHPAWAHATRSAEQSLAERFAQGDIDEKEYRARLEVLRASRPHPER